MRITVIRKRTREPIFDFDSKNGIAICKNGYDVQVVENDNWISVEDKDQWPILENDWDTVSVLVTDGNDVTKGYFHYGYCEGDGIELDCGFGVDTPTHWQLLPKPPKEDTK